MLRRPVPHDAVRRARLRGRARRVQPVERRGDRVARRHRRRRGRASTASRRGATSPTSKPPPRRGRSARRAAACGCGACTCPTAAPSTDRTTSTSWNGLPRCGIRPQAGWPTTRRRRSRWSATGTSPPPTTTCGTSSSSAAARTSPSRSARRSARSSTPVHRRGAAFHARARRRTPTGTTPSCGSRRTRACASTSSSAHRRWPTASTHAEIVRDERKPARRALRAERPRAGAGRPLERLARPGELDADGRGEAQGG